jgi:hypothetical protein
MPHVEILAVLAERIKPRHNYRYTSAEIN